MKLAIFIGHAGKDSGAISTTGQNDSLHTIEAVLNAQVESKISSLCRLVGMDYGVYHGSFNERIEKSKGCSLGLDLHFNSSNSKSASGVEFLYASSMGLRYAQALQAEVLAHRFKVRGLLHRLDLQILNRTKFPCVVAEGGFLSNPTEERLISSEKFQWHYAFCLFSASYRFLNSL